MVKTLVRLFIFDLDCGLFLRYDSVVCASSDGGVRLDRDADSEDAVE